MRFATLLLPFLLGTSVLAEVPVSRLPKIPRYPKNVTRVWRVNADGTRTVIYERGEPTAAPQASSSLLPGEINRNQAAYDHAKREAIYLSQHPPRVWGSNRPSHPFGVGPGGRFAGTGVSFSSSNPVHCFRSWGDSRVIARACAQGSDGRWYWSATLR